MANDTMSIQAGIPVKSLRFLMLALVLTALFGEVAHSQDPDWGRKMLDRTDFKFGSVAKGADVSLAVRVKNIYKEDIQITSGTTGCACVNWDKNIHFPVMVKSGETVELAVVLNTIQFDGERKSKATLSLYEPTKGSAAQIELPVEGYIRKDIVVTPGTIRFDSVDLGRTTSRSTLINYAGRSDWTILQAKCSNSNFTATIVEKSRGAGPVANVSYELTVTLSEKAPPGVLRDQVILTTDDVNNPQVPVAVEAKIEPEFVVLDAQFGQVVAGTSKTQNVVIRSKKPFKIEKIERTKADESFKVKTPQTVSTSHLLPLTFVPPNEPGPFEEEFFVTISGREQPITFKAKGRISGVAAKN